MEELKTCYECGKIIDNDGYELINDEYVCTECYEELYTYCDECGDVVRTDDTHYIDGLVVCDYCLEHYFTMCNNCNEYIRNDDAYDTRDGHVCQYCYENYYVECADCGELIHRDDSTYDEYDDEYYCNDCYDEHQQNAHIKNYSYKPEPEFLGKNNNLYMGIELEIDGAGENNENAGKILNIDGCNRIYCKHDGSLDDGFEIVSHPATLEYHLNNMEWEKILQCAVDMGYTSHNAGTCGLHIHISRNALGNDFDEQENTIAKILYFIEKNWRKMLKFSRRTQSQLDRWASNYGLTENETPDDILKKAKNGYGRYKAINLLNRATIEFRFFRGTLKYNTFVATLQFVHNICNYCKNISGEELKNKCWNDFVNTLTDTELLTYMEDKKLLED